MSATGLEPVTNGLKGHCSTIELRARDGMPNDLHSNMHGYQRQRFFKEPAIDTSAFDCYDCRLNSPISQNELIRDIRKDFPAPDRLKQESVSSK